MPKPLALNEIRARATAFVARWRELPGDERQEAQSFVRDLLAVYGITETRAALYEVRARRTSKGSDGYIDALVPGLAVIEMKSAGKDLAKAEAQALDYLDDLSEVELPRYVLTSDFRHFRLLDLHEPELEAVVFPLDALPIEAERLAFLAGYSAQATKPRDQEQASIRAARLMGSLYEALEPAGYDDHEASVFLVRTLFALYADDAGVWGERDLFTDFIERRTAEDGSDLGAQLTTLYQWLARRERPEALDELIRRFPYVNGGLYEEPLPIPALGREFRERLLVACSFNWSAISPAIFGSLFQAVKDRAARRELGEHYTTETNILKLIGPMFLDEFRTRLDDAGLVLGALERIRTDLAQMRFLDPACGCGNFLVVAYRELRALDLELLKRLQELAPAKYPRTAWFDAADLPVKLAHFHGIEIEEWPARIAETALHLVEHQANQAMALELGGGPDLLPLDKVQNVIVGNALRLDWAEVVEPTEHLYILGNPPFLGHASRTEEQAQELRDVWRRKSIGHLDYVTAWYAKALDLFERPEYAGEFAFVSTNSITQGEPVPALFGPIFDAGWRIKFAHRTFAWTSEAPGAAAVHCVIVGFDRGTSPARLFTYASPRSEPDEVAVSAEINGYLIDGPRVLVSSRSKPISGDLPPVTFGSMPNDGGHLIIEATEYEDIAGDLVAAQYLRRFVMGSELIRGLPRWCLWMDDLHPADVERSSVLRERIALVRATRLASARTATRALATTPHLFGERRQPSVPYVAIPAVFAENRRFLTAAHFPPEVIAGNKVFVCPDDSGIAFAIVSSSALMQWQKAIGGRLKSDPNFSSSLTWNTFPLPPLSDSDRDAIISGGQAVLAARALHPERSLAEHYHPLAMDPALLAAHRVLDKAVDRAFGLTGAVSDEDRLRALFDSYARLTATDA